MKKNQKFGHGESNRTMSHLYSSHGSMVRLRSPQALLTVSFFLLAFFLLVVPAYAKKKNKDQPHPPVTVSPSAAATRVNQLSGDDKRRFDDLTKEQQNLIIQGKIDKGFNAWMVKLALGEPYYATEHHPVFTDYAEVWLYTKPDVSQDVQEERILDLQTNWPTIHRKITKKSCAVGDFFILWDRGVVQNVHPTNEKKTYGSCTIENREEFLPIVNGKPVEPKSLK